MVRVVSLLCLVAGATAFAPQSLSSSALGLRSSLHPLLPANQALRPSALHVSQGNVCMQASKRSLLRQGASWMVNKLTHRTKRRVQHRPAGGAQAMFTGIVEEMGSIDEMKMELQTPGVTMKVAANVVLDGAYEGCSISVNGVCLTVTEFDRKTFTVGIAPETIRLTNLGELIAGSPVNLERAAAIDGRNSGHMVQGHVDNVGEIIETWPDKESLFFKVKVPKELMKYIVPKGFIAIDGTSLTVCETNVAENWFTFMLVEYTQSHVIIPQKKAGEKLNIEVDVLSKYVARSIEGVTDRLDKIEEVLGMGSSATPGSIDARLKAVEEKAKS